MYESMFSTYFLFRENFLTKKKINKKKDEQKQQ